MTFDFSGKTALVTGAASGIGAAVAVALAEAGVAKLVLVDIDKDALGAMRMDCEVATFAGDVADEALWDRIESECGPLDLALLNAGIAGEGAPIAKMPLSNWRKVVSVNLDGVFLSLRSAMRLANDGASVVITGSVAGLKAEQGIGPYGASKAAVLHLTKIAAKEAAARRIRVNAIAPGGVDTAIWDGAPFFEDLVVKHQGDRAGALATLAESMTPMGRFETSEEIAGQVLFLLSDAAGTMTGTTLVTDGGYRL